MALLYRYTNTDQSVDVQYLFDAYDGHKRLVITEVRGISEEEIKLGFLFETGIQYWHDDFTKFAVDNHYNLDVYDSGVFKGRVVDGDTGVTLTISLDDLLGGITNPAPGEYSLEKDSTHSIESIPNSGYRHNKFTVDGEDDTDNPITVLMDTAKSIVAYFTKTWNIGISKTGNGTINPIVGDYVYDDNVSITLTATESDNDYCFNAWEKSGNVISTDSEYLLTVNENQTINAVFTELIENIVGDSPIYQSGNYYFKDRTTKNNDLQLKNVAVLYLALADYMNSAIITSNTDIVRCYAKITNVGSNSLNGINESNNRFYFGVLSGKWGAGIGATAVISTTTADTNWHLFEFNGTTKTFKVDGVTMCTMTGTFTPGTNPFYFGSTSGTAANSVIYMAWAEILDTNGNKKAFWGFKENYGTMAIDLSGNGHDGTITSSDIVTARGSRLDNAEDFNIKLGYTLFQQIADPTRYIKATYTISGVPTKTAISGYNKLTEVPANVISKITSTTFTGLPISEFNTAKGYDDFVIMASKLISIVKNDYYISRIKIKKDGDEATPYTLAVNNAASLLGYIVGNGQGITKSEANLAFWDFAFNSDSNVRTFEINYSLTGINNITFRDMSTDTVIGALRVDFNEDYPSIHAIYNDSNIIGFPQILGYALIKPNEFKRLTSGTYYATLNNSLAHYNKFITKNIIPELLIATLGDSLTALGSGYGNYLKTPKTTVACHGIGGETPLQICGRYGLIPFLTRTEFTIPASNSTPVSVPIKSSWNGSTITGVGVYGMQTGSIAGIAGSFSKSGDLLMFTRTTAGAATVIPVDTEIKTYAGENYLNKILILWMGQNGGFSSADDLVNMFKACAAKITSGKYIFISPPLNTSDELEAKMLAEFGDKYINIREWGYTTALADCGITNPTAEDLAAQAAHLIPPSLRVDYVHFNAAARSFQGGTMIPNKIKSLNYV